MAEAAETQQLIPRDEDVRALAERAATGGPDALLAVAVARGASMEELEKLLSLKERFDAMEAKKAFTAAMAQFKKNAPAIFKDKHVEFTTDKGKTSYNHATLGKVAAVVAASLGEYGLSHRWEMNQDDPARIVCSCIITHELGHSEKTTLIAGADTSGGKNPIQAVASSVTYLERYTLLGATGLAAQEGDDDGVAAGDAEAPKTLTEEQIATVQEYIDEAPDSEEFEGALMAWCKQRGFEHWERVTVEKYDRFLRVVQKAFEARRQA